MQVSAKTEYACLAVLDLALQFETDQPVRVAAIAERQGIPPRFLVQILLQLKGAGIVSSVRGAAGGYRLARPPHDTSLWDVVSLFEKDLPDPTGAAVGEPARELLRSVWANLAAQRRRTLTGLTFADLAERLSSATTNMYYI